MVALDAGEAVEVACRSRRTTPRGWAAWVDGALHLPDADGGPATFVVDDPTQVNLVTRQGAAPVVFDPPLEVEVRPARYKAETFYGSGSEILVVTSPRRQIELALPDGVVEPVAGRLAALG